MNKIEQHQAARPYPHLAVALLLMSDDSDIIKDKKSNEMSAIIQQTNLLTGEMNPVKVIF